MTTRILQMENVYSWKTRLLNLVSGSLLNRTNLKIVLEGDKVVLTRNREFVSKGYLSNGLFILDIVSMNANGSYSAYIVEYVDLWVPHRKLDKTPYELWKGYAPNLSYLRVWDAWLRHHFLH
ncbi:ty1-copia retrotransposon protein [Cucumis melo var. makuwa]|uniref:Ty1-copia retrotransposon protein n=1 Tax=Cucumis melo var. makuwa TaxID=1194695 RepID=A0A5A7SZK0_CUCMM|nr:ty1-copia retrotransposon protein [Cucumis melo var. makuwa]